MRVLAPAKVNLSLRIVGRRSDGYHLLDSLVVPVSLYDEIHLERTARTPQIQQQKAREPTIQITCDDPTIPVDETNLVYRAAVLLCRQAGISARLSFSLQKRIPAGAGLGGGSSDAAAVLKGLNTLLATGLTEVHLCTLAARLGADVPFFIPCRPARLEGIGEVVTAVPLPPVRWVVILVPPFEVSTPWAYRRFDALVPEKRRPVAPLKTAGNQGLPKWCVNDLERAVLPAYPLIGHLKQRLHQLGAEMTLMSGSGSAVFGTFPSQARAESAVTALEQHVRAFLVEPLSGPP